MKNTKKAILAGTMALAILGGGALYSAGAVHAAAATADKSANASQKPPKDAQGQFGQIGQFQDKLGKLLSLDNDALRTQLKQNTLGEVAEKQGVSKEKLKTNLSTWLKENPPVGANASNTTDYSAMAEKLLAAKGNVLPGDANGPKAAGGNYAENKALLKLLGLSSSELNTQLKSGKTLAAIAKAQSVNVKEVISLLVSDTKSRMAEEKKNGKVTDTEYNNRISNLEKMVTDLVNGVKPSQPPVGTSKAPAKSAATK
ncbi:hypothetical protein [Paenibacillus terrae]|uniref:hypothetical protein n=1 Tax=Paenibacillus terrae TaxID=159743 RepID=UPI002695D18D